MVPITVLIPSKNEELNISRCLQAVSGWADQIVVVDSQSTDKTIEIAESYGAEVIQFYYEGGWPKKRQWALDNHNLRNEWVLLLDTDEILLEPVKNEIAEAIHSTDLDGYWINFQIVFLGRQLRYGDTNLWKLFLFRKGKGRYEKRLENQDKSMSDIEVHEHIIVEGKVDRLKHPVRHENINSLDRYIQKHNEYSNWEASLALSGYPGELKPSLWGNQAQRRRRLKSIFTSWPFSPLVLFLYRYILKLGFFDRKAGFLYLVFQAIYIFETKAKIYEKSLSSK